MSDISGEFDNLDFNDESPDVNHADIEESGKDKSVSDKQSRDWMLTIPATNHSKEDVTALLEKIGTGAVFQLETGVTTGYEHFQCFLQVKSPMRFSTLKNHLTTAGFKDAHIEPRHGTVESCVAYCTKPDTRVSEPVLVGAINMKDKRGQRSELAFIREQLLNGVPRQQILLNDIKGNTVRCIGWMRELDEAYTHQKYGNTLRDVRVHYLYGAPGVGKTHHIYSLYSFEDIYRVTNYMHPFDEYDRHKILVFDDYESQLPWEQILSYLDPYPVTLPARYHDHQACFDTVWIISNLPLAAQYPGVTGERRLALLRRITDCYRMLDNGTLTEELLPSRHCDKIH